MDLAGATRRAAATIGSRVVCDPEGACSCMCTEHRNDAYSAQQRQLLPPCRSGKACGSCAKGRTHRVQEHRSSFAIAIVYAYEPRYVRDLYRQMPLGQYLRDTMLMVRLVLSLRRVKTTLPIHLYLSGERREKYERLFRALGVRILDLPPVKPAPWAQRWHAGSFAKLHALSLVGLDTVLVLDIDTVVLRNIDHMAAWQAPSFRYQTVRSGRECLWELQSGVMLLQPSRAEHARALNMTARWSATLPGDGGDQSVWRALYARTSIHELPTAYNAFKYELRDAGEWEKVFVLHDGWTRRFQAKWSDQYPAVGRVLSELSSNATRLMNGAADLNVSAVPKGKYTCFFQRLRKGYLRVCDLIHLEDSVNLISPIFNSA